MDIFVFAVHLSLTYSVTLHCQTNAFRIPLICIIALAYESICLIVKAGELNVFLD
jgi:hypothetical protein